jgi:hypothetical protein
MKKKRNISLSLRIGILVMVLAVLGWFLAGVFEGEKPGIELKPLPEFISAPEKFSLTITDKKRGLKNLEISVRQEGRKIPVLKRDFSFKGLFNKGGSHRYDTEFSVDPSGLNLAQGRVDLEVRVRDYSRRSGGDGNLSLFQHQMVVDTIPPAVRAVSRMHNVNVGGAGLVVYQTSSDTVESGVYVNSLFFPGFRAEDAYQEGSHVCYFAIPYDTEKTPEIRLWAKDRAGNTSTAGLYTHVRRQHFRTEKINISEGFLNRVLPYFSFVSYDTGTDLIGKFLKINRDLRKENESTYYGLRTRTSPHQLWSGAWLRLKNAATMARFADRRFYFYKGDKVDEQVHLGVDLASLTHSDVQAANSGRVLFADRLGIYGLTVVLDHGQGLASVYGHLSKISVAKEQDVTRGQIIGQTGETGLAGGDHLHFGVMVSGVFVNPIEWWDPHWIEDNIIRKLALLKNDK